METRYNVFAGGSAERLAALSDGVFAVAMTLLVLDLHVPATEALHSEHDLRAALIGLLPRLCLYLMSFLTLGIFWVGQQTQLNHFARSNRDLTWIHLGFLFAVTLMPFSTVLMGDFIAYRTALVIYWLNILLLGAILFASWRYATRHGLLREGVAAQTGRDVERRIIIAQSLYGVGALLSVISTTWSLVFIMLVQLNYVLAPRIGILQRL